MARLTLQVNGAARDVEVDDPATPLLYVLRNDLALTGTKFGCGLAQCGACTVHLDGQAIRSCAMPVSAAVGRQVTTIEGLGSPERPDPVQAAFIAEQAPQCGYCTAGLVMAARAFLAAEPAADRVRGQAGAGREPLPLREPRPGDPGGDAGGHGDGRGVRWHLRSAAARSSAPAVPSSSGSVSGAGRPGAPPRRLGAPCRRRSGRPTATSARRWRPTRSTPSSRSTPTTPSPSSRERWISGRAAGRPCGRWWRRSWTSRSSASRS